MTYLIKTIGITTVLLLLLFASACSAINNGIGNGDYNGDNGIWTTTVDWTVQNSTVEYDTDITYLGHIRTATHEDDGYDRVVFDFQNNIPTYRIAYVDSPQHECGSGNPVYLDGDGWLEIRFESAQAHSDQGDPLFTPTDFDLSYDNLVHMEMTCDFEGYVTYIMAVESPNDYRVIENSETNLVVVDIRN